LHRIQRKARVVIQADAKKGAKSVIAILRSNQRTAMHSARHNLASCSLVCRQKLNETGIKVERHCAELKENFTL